MSVAAHPSIGGEAEVRRLRTLYQLLATLNRASALEDVYAAAIASLLAATSADRAAILLFDDDGVVRFKAASGLSAEYQAEVTGHSPWARGSLNAEPVVVPDVLLDESLAPFRGAFERENIRALAFVPLALDGGVFGKFVLYYGEVHECRGGELEISQAIAAHIALATQHQRAEVARARSEQRLQAILDNSAAIIFVKDTQGRYLLVNRRYEEIFHVTKAEAVGRTDLDIFPEETANQYRANDRAVLAAGVPITSEETARQDDGMHTYVSMKFPLQEPDGTVTGVCGIATDISDRKEAEAVSRRLAAIVESSGDAIIGKDTNGIITSWNKAAERMFGYTADEITGRHISTLAEPDRVDEMPAILSQVLEGHHVEHFETRRRRKDGQVIDVALSVSPVRDGTGRIVGASKIARDITDRKVGEKERTALLAREQEARRIAELLNLVGPRLAAQLDMEKLVQELTEIATALVVAEAGSFFQKVVNDTGEAYSLNAISGVSRGALAGWPVFPGAGVMRCDDATVDSRLDGCPLSIEKAEGRLPVRSYLAAPVVARSGEVLGGLFFGHTLAGRFTEAHEAILTGMAAQAAIAMDNARLFEQAQWAQAELKLSNEELRRANRDLEVFAYSASHDLQEPLRTVAISAQLIERNCGRQLSGREAGFLADINAAARRMSGLIEDLLTYARATKSEEGPAPVVDAGRTLGEVLEGLRGLIQESGAIITTGELPTVGIHAGRLAQVFQNLIGNAIKYHGKEVPRVEITAVNRDGWCVFSVADNGIGIEAEYAERIFGLFKRLHGRDEYPGNGIGLAICQRVVERYGGRIWLERSERGAGSTFCFSVPLCT